MVVEVAVHADNLISPGRPSTLPRSWLTIDFNSIHATVMNLQDMNMKEIYSKSPTTGRILKWFTRADDIRILVCETEL